MIQDYGPLVFIPGLLSDETVWKAQLRYFAQRHEVIVPTAHLERPTIADMARAILDNLPQRFCPVGWSMGGYISLEIMRRRPNSVARLALISTTARQDSQDRIEKRWRSIRQVREYGPSRAFGEKLDLTFHRPKRLPRAMLAELEAMNDRLGADIYEIHQRAMAARADTRDVLPSIQCPTIVIAGVHDRTIPPRCAWEIASAIQGGELHLLAGCGHSPPLEDPEMVNFLIDTRFERFLD